MAASEKDLTTAVDEMLRRGFDDLDDKTLEERVLHLMDREEIRELSARYAQAISRHRSPIDLFAIDGVFANGGSRAIRGRAQLEETYAAYTGGARINRPMVHNQVISISEDEATGTCWIDLHATNKDGKLSPRAGYYEDRMCREDGRWKFAIRGATMEIEERPPRNPGSKT